MEREMHRNLYFVLFNVFHWYNRKLKYKEDFIINECVSIAKILNSGANNNDTLNDIDQPFEHTNILMVQW